MVSLDNVGVWNLRTENLDRWYLGQETYMRIVNPEENNTTELAAPDNVLYCGGPWLQAEVFSLYLSPSLPFSYKTDLPNVVLFAFQATKNLFLVRINYQWKIADQKSSRWILCSACHFISVIVYASVVSL